MCLAIPARIEKLLPDGAALVRVGEGEVVLNVSVILLPEPPAVGDYVIVHAGFAISRLDPADAEETLKILREMAEHVGK